MGRGNPCATYDHLTYGGLFLPFVRRQQLESKTTRRPVMRRCAAARKSNRRLEEKMTETKRRSRARATCSSADTLGGLQGWIGPKLSRKFSPHT
jgi:hypothetical protein